MNIALIADDAKKELMIQFCIAYSGILHKHNMSSTDSTGRMVSEATGLRTQKFLGGEKGGVQQISARVACNEVDLLIFFRDPMKPFDPHTESMERNLLKVCDQHNVPTATNIATAEALIHSLNRGDLDWREIVKARAQFYSTYFFKILCLFGEGFLINKLWSHKS